MARRCLLLRFAAKATMDHVPNGEMAAKRADYFARVHWWFGMLIC